MLTYLNWIFGLDISVKLVMLDVSLPELNYATINRMCKWSTECWEVDQMSRLQLCSSIFVRFNLWLQRAAVQQWAGQQVNIYRICLCPFSAIVWGVGVRCWKPIIGTHTFTETLRPRACAMCPEVHLLRPLAIIVAIVMNGLIVTAEAVLARDAPGCGARCSELSEWINHVLTSPTFDTFDTCSLILILTFCAELCCAGTGILGYPW